jgi:N-acetyl-gamma-glutamyl-phosphate reductase
MVKAGIVGASGYTGHELVRLLKSHPAAELVFATSETFAGSTLKDLFPAAPRLELIAAQDAPLDQADVVFLCLPHGAAAPTAVAALEAGARVVDLSADFRLRDPATYAQWYGLEHPAPHLLAEAVYGLTEFARAELPAARLVANPGCYPTSILLPLQALLSAGAVKGNGTIIADSKSGVSGAGRSPKQHTHFVEVANNLSPYSIGRVHRHLPEMEQELAGWNSTPPTLIFSPHLLPVPRGILSTIYLTLADGWTESQVRALYQNAFKDESFVELLPAGQLASLAHVTMTNHCVFSLTAVGDTVILTSAIDNLIKGAAGQAVQNMNVMFGLQETVGLK